MVGSSALAECCHRDMRLQYYFCYGYMLTFMSDRRHET